MEAANKGLVLAIEDDAPTARVMRLILEPEGYTLNVVANRDEALRVIEAEPPDIMIMDYLMDGLGAESFVHRARAAGFRGPILLCTAMHQELDLPVDDVLLKPFDPDELPKKLAALLSAERA